MSVELPKDAEGREIPLDVDALYDKNGNRVEVFRWNCLYDDKTDAIDAWNGRVSDESDN